jgi:D-alanyl-D-alanine carboxypeptidase
MDTRVGGPVNQSSNEASSFNFTDEKWKELPETDMSVPGGAGAVISTTPDMTRFITALFDGKLISADALKTMTSMKDGFGQGIFKIPFYEHSGFGHTGGIDGFSSVLTYFPDDKVALAFCSNGMNYAMNDILIGILSDYYGKPYKIPTFETVTLAAGQLSAFEGDYNSDQISLIITVKQEGDHLTAQATGQPSFPLTAVSETEFRFDQAGVRMIFVKEPNGVVSGFTLQQGGDYRYTRMKK